MCTCTRVRANTHTCTHACEYNKPHLTALCKDELLRTVIVSSSVSTTYYLKRQLKRRCIPHTISEVSVHPGNQGIEEHLTSGQTGSSEAQRLHPPGLTPLSCFTSSGLKGWFYPHFWGRRTSPMEPHITNSKVSINTEIPASRTHRYTQSFLFSSCFSVRSG